MTSGWPLPDDRLHPVHCKDTDPARIMRSKQQAATSRCKQAQPSSESDNTTRAIILPQFGTFPGGSHRSRKTKSLVEDCDDGTLKGKMGSKYIILMRHEFQHVNKGSIEAR
ncbi:hypothetical protein B0H13DRAFT_1851566 [Mycena leptocephala]|nr:hypothetical protein B0H13DRAFT_1851566 [Mycena leptocephala]